MEEVVRKSNPDKLSITASELRYAYRNWERLEGKIHFYRDETEVKAPWIENSLLWTEYKPKDKSNVFIKLFRSISYYFSKEGSGKASAF